MPCNLLCHPHHTTSTSTKIHTLYTRLSTICHRLQELHLSVFDLAGKLLSATCEITPTDEHTLLSNRSETKALAAEFACLQSTFKRYKLRGVFVKYELKARESAYQGSSEVEWVCWNVAREGCGRLEERVGILTEVVGKKVGLLEELGRESGKTMRRDLGREVRWGK